MANLGFKKIKIFSPTGGFNVRLFSGPGGRDATLDMSPRRGQLQLSKPALIWVCVQLAVTCCCTFDRDAGEPICWKMSSHGRVLCSSRNWVTIDQTTKRCLDLAVACASGSCMFFHQLHHHHRHRWTPPLISDLWCRFLVKNAKKKQLTANRSLLCQKHHHGLHNTKQSKQDKNPFNVSDFYRCCFTADLIDGCLL